MEIKGYSSFFTLFYRRFLSPKADKKRDILFIIQYAELTNNHNSPIKVENSAATKKKIKKNKQ